MRHMTYNTKLKNPLWQRKRLEVFNKDNWACVQCNSKDKELQVHHVDYISDIEPWNYPLDMLVTLCVDCHKIEIGRHKVEKIMLTSLKMNGFLFHDILHLSCLIDTNINFRDNLLNDLRNV